MIMLRKLKRKGGYVLIWVVSIFLIVALLSSVIISLSIISTQSTIIQYNRQQAYYTARSAAVTMADYIIDNSSDSALINNLLSSTGHGSVQNMGEYTVNVVYSGTNKLVITATATLRGEKSTVTVNLIKPPPSGILPVDNVIYLNGSADTGFGQCVMNGSIYVDGNLNLSNGSAINGFTIVKGTTTITGAGNSTNGLFSYGNVILDNGGAVAGDVFTKGDLKVYGSACITGNAYVDGSLDMTSGSSTISKDAKVGNNASFAGGDNRIAGILYYGGSVTCAYGNVNTFVNQGAVKINDYTPVDESPFITQALPVIFTPTIDQFPALYNTVIINNNTISESGTINAFVVTQLNQMPYGTTVTIDANAKDISLLLNNTNLNLSNGLNIEVDGTHNVFIYLTGASSISVNSNEYIGMKVRGTNPRLYIFGDGEQSISLNNNSELDACVYVPNGTLNASGSPLTTYKFIGSCVVKRVNVSSDVLFFYSKSEIENTPLSIFLSDQYGTIQHPWKVESWDSN